jgi:hypothetical protein
MLVKDEKILMSAKQSDNPNDIFKAILQVVNNCSMDPKLDVQSMPIFQLEYVFLCLRIASIQNVIELSYVDSEDHVTYNFKVDLDEIKLKYKDTPVSNVIEVGDDVSVEMRYPPASLYANVDFLDTADPAKYFEEMLLSSIKAIYKGDDEVWEAKDVTKQELLDFVESLNSTAYKKIQEFLENVPHMEHIIKYTNKNGTEREIALRTLNDFFML